MVLSVPHGLFHQNPCTVWLPNTNKNETNNMKHETDMLNTSPTLAYPTQILFHWLMLDPLGCAFGLSAKLFGYEHVGIGNAKCISMHWVSKPS